MVKVSKKPVTSNEIVADDRQNPKEGPEEKCWERECKVWRTRVKKINQRLSKLEKKFRQWRLSAVNSEGRRMETDVDSQAEVKLPYDIVQSKSALEKKRSRFQKFLMEALDKLDEKTLAEKLGKIKFS